MGASDDVGRSPDALRVFRDERGALTLTDFDVLPFAPTRAYVLHNIPIGAHRGGHGHRVQHRFLVGVSGPAAVVEDNGRAVDSFEVEAGDSLHIPPRVLHELEALDEGMVGLVLTS